MRNFTSLSVIIACSFLMFSFNSTSNTLKNKNDIKEFENVFASKNNFVLGTLDAASISSFYKKYPKLKKYQTDVEELYKRKNTN